MKQIVQVKQANLIRSEDELVVAGDEGFELLKVESVETSIEEGTGSTDFLVTFVGGGSATVHLSAVVAMLATPVEE
jgi:hypothetical protein